MAHKEHLFAICIWTYSTYVVPIQIHIGRSVTHGLCDAGGGFDGSHVWLVGVEDFMRRFLPGKSSAKSIFALAQLNGIARYACHKVSIIFRLCIATSVSLCNVHITVVNLRALHAGQPCAVVHNVLWWVCRGCLARIW